MNSNFCYLMEKFWDWFVCVWENHVTFDIKPGASVSWNVKLTPFFQVLKMPSLLLKLASYLVKETKFYSDIPLVVLKKAQMGNV